MIADLRFALRQLAKTPGFTTVALLTLALGIGANTAVFSVVESVLLRPLPYPDPAQLAILWEDETNFEQASIAWPDLQDWQRDSHAFSAIGGYRRDNYIVTGRGDAEMLRGAAVSASFFDTIQLPPALGRVFSAEEDKVGAPGLVVLGYPLWQRKFAGRKDVLGESLTLNGDTFTIIGVLPPEFATPNRADFWTQLARISQQPGWESRGNHPGIYAIARMKPGQTFASALADLKQVSARIAKDHPETSTGVTAAGELLFENTVGNYRKGLLVLLAAVGLVLLIACANLANLLLARSAAREAEMAVRAALGASRIRLVRQLLVESTVLAVGGAALGVMVAAWAQHGIIALAPAGVTRFQQVSIDATVLAATAATALVTVLLFGLWPAWRAARPDLRSSLATGGRGGSEGRRAARLREALVVAEIALTLILLTGAGLLLRSFERMQTANLGFDGRRVLTARISLPRNLYPKHADRRAFFDRVREHVGGLPGVTGVDIATNPPLDTGWQTNWHVPGTPPAPNGQEPLAEMNVVSDGYFKTLGIPLLRGRGFGAADEPDSARAVIIDQAFAERAWPGREAVGQPLQINGRDDNPAIVVGVVPTLKAYGYATEPRLVQAYLPMRQVSQSDAMILVRAERDAASISTAVRHAVAELDPNKPLWDVRTMDDRISGTFATPRLYTYLLAIFAGLALLLAAVGLYGVLAFQVGRRTREFGIRIALGALHGQVMALVVKRGAALLGAGLLVGIVGALALGRVLGSLLYQTSAFDLVVLGSVALVLGLIAMLASWLPARRALRINPTIALRAD